MKVAKNDHVRGIAKNKPMHIAFLFLMKKKAFRTAIKIGAANFYVRSYLVSRIIMSYVCVPYFNILGLKNVNLLRDV